jgi:REP element-mobilizing transposase RayT
MILNDFGKTAFDEWIQLSERYHNVVLDVFYIMPNHIHGIVALCNAATNVGATLAVAQNAVAQNVVAQNAVAQNMNNGAGVSYSGAGASPAPTATHTPTVGNIVGSYKSLVANKCLEIYKSRNKYMGKLWQRNYYEHIIRNDYAYNHIANYIINNPANWIDDRFYME